MEVTNVKTYKYAPHLIVEDEEANKIIKYGELKEIKAYIYPAGGQVQAQKWGSELHYVFNLLTNEDKLKEKDGLCFNSDTVNYEVVSILPYSEHFQIEIKKLWK